MEKNQFLAATTSFTIVLLLVTLLLNRLFYQDFFPHAPELSAQAAAVIAVAAALLIGFMYLFIQHDRFIIPDIVEKMTVFKGVLINLSQPEKIYLSCLAGLSEELLFRGLLQPLLGITIASILFGAMHFITFGYALLAAVIGFYLGFLFDYTGNILIPILVHAIYNVFAFNMLARIYSMRPPAPEQS
jgi:uncharacterized protein